MGIRNEKPTLYDLLEKVAAEIPAKWEEVGYALGITRPSMQHNPMTAYREMFSVYSLATE